MDSPLRDRMIREQMQPPNVHDDRLAARVAARVRGIGIPVPVALQIPVDPAQPQRRTLAMQMSRKIHSVSNSKPPRTQGGKKNKKSGKTKRRNRKSSKRAKK